MKEFNVNVIAVLTAVTICIHECIDTLMALGYGHEDSKAIVMDMIRAKLPGQPVDSANVFKAVAYRLVDKCPAEANRDSLKQFLDKVEDALMKDALQQEASALAAQDNAKEN